MNFRNDLIPYNEDSVRVLWVQDLGEVTGLLCELSKIDSEFDNYANKEVKNRLNILFSRLNFPITVIYEPYYVDKVYRDEYYQYYSRKHFNISRNTKRLIFVEGKYSKKDFLCKCPQKIQQINNDLIGMVVLKPTKTIGKMLISPFKLNIPDCYLKTTLFDFFIFGKKYTINAFPSSGQDSEGMTCAEVNIWQIMEFFGTSSEEYRVILPSDLYKILNENPNTRILPSEGLNEDQESLIFFRNGFLPKIYNKYDNSHDENNYSVRTKNCYEPSFEELLSIYVESGIPILGNLAEKGGSVNEEGHSVTFIGHGYKKFNKDCFNNDFIEMPFCDSTIDKTGIKYYNNYDKIKILKTWTRYNEFVIMEDHSTPYQIKSLDNLQFDDLKLDSDDRAVKWELDSFLVPLHRHVFMDAEDAYKAVLQLLHNNSEEIIDNLGSNEVVIRLFLTSSRLYKEFRVNNAKSLNECVFFSQVAYPKNLWICEYGSLDSYCQHKAKGEFLLDATSSENSITESVISIRHGNSITYRGPNDAFENAVVRLNIRLDSDFLMYEQKNLIFINHEGGLS